VVRKLGNDFRRGAALALQCQTQFAHDVGALEGDLARHRVGHLSFKALSQRLQEARCQGFRQRL
jgi:hypothetical protein